MGGALKCRKFRVGASLDEEKNSVDSEFNGGDSDIRRIFVSSGEQKGNEVGNGRN